MYSVGSGMVLAIGDLAGATVVTLLAATASLPDGSLWTIEIEVAVTGAVIELRAMVPVAPRKSAAIIPSVNETLTGGLPIDPTKKSLMIWVGWLPRVEHLAGIARVRRR